MGELTRESNVDRIQPRHTVSALTTGWKNLVFNIKFF